MFLNYLLFKKTTSLTSDIEIIISSIFSLFCLFSYEKLIMNCVCV